MKAVYIGAAALSAAFALTFMITGHGGQAAVSGWIFSAIGWGFASILH